MFVFRKFVSIVCPKVTQWWCRLFIKLNSFCQFFMVAIGNVGGFFSFFALLSVVFNAFDRVADSFLIHFNTNLLIWFNLRFMCGRSFSHYCFLLFAHLTCTNFSTNSSQFFIEINLKKKKKILALVRCPKLILIKF